MWRYFDNGIKQKINGYTWNDMITFNDEVTVTGAKFSCKDEEFRGLVNQACKTKSQAALSKAVSFWKNWLNDPITRKKVEQNWIDESNFISIYSGYHRVSSNYAWNKYFKILNNLNLIFYDKTNPNELLTAFAYVRPGESLYDIHINCAYYDIELLETLVHEIQHLLYHVKPLNPANKIRDAFVDKNTKIENISNILNFNKLVLPNILPLGTSKDPKILETSKKLNINYSVLENWKKSSIEWQKKEDTGYVCRETEKMSNVYAIRSLFGVKASSKITLNMLMPYIKKEKNHGDIDFIILCWAQQGFPDINGMLDKINKLAFKQDDEQPKIGDLPKPNFS